MGKLGVPGTGAQCWAAAIVLHQPFFPDTLHVFVSATLCVVGGVRDSIVSLVLRAVVAFPLTQVCVGVGLWRAQGPAADGASSQFRDRASASGLGSAPVDLRSNYVCH
eukprot:COSAG01_NODE_903_length_12848_cov_7.966899_11_plen_108_part_00